jgi:hypothetical protein
LFLLEQPASFRDARFITRSAQVVDRQIWRHSDLSFGRRSIPEETAVALAYNGGTQGFADAAGLC